MPIVGVVAHDLSHQHINNNNTITIISINNNAQM